MEKLKVLDLFSGIGGFSLGLERTGQFQIVAFCEIDDFCQKVLSKNWQNVPIFSDIRSITSISQLGEVDVVCGGFPCQPVSCSGKQLGDQDERWLWPEFYRIVLLFRPKFVLVENVVGLLSAQQGRLFGGILRNLAQAGYNAEWQVLSASQFGLPHIRKRMFLVAYPNSERFIQNAIFERNKLKGIETRRTKFGNIYITDIGKTFIDISNYIREIDGIPIELDENIESRIHSLGNSIVPYCSEYIGNLIINSLKDDNTNYQNL